MTDILFVVKDKNVDTNKKQVSGLIAAASQNVEYLKSQGIKAELVTIPDANFLDSQIKQYHPKVVVLEAVWVNPEKFKTLIPANPFVEEFVIRIHSDMAYLAVEGQGLDWCLKSQKISPKIKIAANCENFYNAINPALPNKFIYLPNIFDKPLTKSRKAQDYNRIDIGIFGAVRMLKNHATQVLAAIKAAEEMNKILHLHMNDLTNDAGHAILINIRTIFAENNKHKLINVGWKSNEEYDILIRQMDIGMQLSFTESFNIVAANFVVNGVPVVVGDTITWVPSLYKTSYTDINSISAKIKELYGVRNNTGVINDVYNYLNNYNSSAKMVWNEYILNTIKK